VEALGLFAESSSTATSRGRAARVKQKLTRVSDDILQAIRAAEIRGSGEVIELVLPRMTPKAYVKAKEMLLICGFTWSTRMQTHRGTRRARAALDQVAASGFYDDTIRALEFYATSPSTAAMLAKDLADNVWVDGTARILEPGAGDGALVAAVLEQMDDVVVTAVEIDPARAEDLRERFAGDERVRVICADVLTIDEGAFDGVIMNPPFAESFALIRHAVGLTRRGGYIVGIAMLTRCQDALAAAWLHDHDAIVWPTEPDAFAGTTIAASCFAWRKEVSYLERLRSALEPHTSIGELHVRELTRISRDLHILFTAHCNGEIEGERYDEHLNGLLTLARSLTAHEGIEIKPAWDPRAGHGMGLRLPSGLTNDFGQRYIIVPSARAELTPLEQLALRRYSARTALSTSKDTADAA
jgi:SAM-dependent methyltransferase